MLRWVVIPGVLGSATGILVAVVPWGRYVLVFGLVVSGLAWLLRGWRLDRRARRPAARRRPHRFGAVRDVAGDGDQPAGAAARWVRADSPGSRTEDPHALPPAGSKSVIPSLKDPSEPIDPVQPLRDLMPCRPTSRPRCRPRPPTAGRARRADPRLSSSVSRFGEGVC